MINGFANLMHNVPSSSRIIGSPKKSTVFSVLGLVIFDMIIFVQYTNNALLNNVK